MSISSHTIIINAILRSEKWLVSHNIPPDHGINHALTVLLNASKAIDEYNDIDIESKEDILLAALGHDLDDSKYFPNAKEEGINFVLQELNLSNNRINRIKTMINLVSFSKNGLETNGDYPKWYYIPRDSDRIEAIGYIGIKRAYDTTYIKGPIWYTDTTPRVKTIEELKSVAPESRVIDYIEAHGKSKSLIDHFYDKIVHIHILSSGSKYLQNIANERHKVVLDFIFEFGKTGTIDWSKWLSLS